MECQFLRMVNPNGAKGSNLNLLNGVEGSNHHGVEDLEVEDFNHNLHGVEGSNPNNLRGVGDLEAEADGCNRMAEEDMGHFLEVA